MFNYDSRWPSSQRFNGKWMIKQHCVSFIPSVKTAEFQSMFTEFYGNFVIGDGKQNENAVQCKRWNIMSEYTVTLMQYRNIGSVNRPGTAKSLSSATHFEHADSITTLKSCNLPVCRIITSSKKNTYTTLKVWLMQASVHLT